MALTTYLLDNQLPPISHYSHAVRAGNLLFISGVVGVDADGMSPEDTVDQFRMALRSIKEVLDAAGAKPSDIAKVTVLLTDVDDRARINPLRQEFFGEHRPASTLFQVAALARPDWKVEIEAIAVLER